MGKYIDVLCDSFYMIFISTCGVFVAFWAAVFSIGSAQTMQRLIAEEGIALIVLKRFVAFTLLGIILSLIIALMSLLVVALSKQKDFGEPLRVFVVSAIFQTVCAFVGSMLALYGLA
jgi:hypothetical protein